VQFVSSVLSRYNESESPQASVDLVLRHDAFTAHLASECPPGTPAVTQFCKSIPFQQPDSLVSAVFDCLSFAPFGSRVECLAEYEVFGPYSAAVRFHCATTSTAEAIPFQGTDSYQSRTPPVYPGPLAMPVFLCHPERSRHLGRLAEHEVLHHHAEALLVAVVHPCHLRGRKAEEWQRARLSEL
jgi:hypothetical protein